MISLKYEAANAANEALISSFYNFEYTGDTISEPERADRAQFRFYLNGGGEYRFSTGHVDPSFPVTIIGPTTGQVAVTVNGDVGIFGWGITPVGWDALMGSSAEKWIDRAFDARTIFGDSIMELRQQLIEISDIAERFALAQRAACKIHQSSGSAPFEFTGKVDQWLIGSLVPDIHDLIQATGLSIRQLERTTKHYYGMPPKKLARKYRALRAAHLLSSGDSLDDSGLGLAFYDQSHLIREIRQFTGLTPKQLRSGHSVLTDATIKGRGLMSGKVGPLISDS